MSHAKVRDISGFYKDSLRASRRGDRAHLAEEDKWLGTHLEESRKYSSVQGKHKLPGDIGYVMDDGSLGEDNLSTTKEYRRHYKSNGLGTSTAEFNKQHMQLSLSGYTMTSKTITNAAKQLLRHGSLHVPTGSGPNTPGAASRDMSRISSLAANRGPTSYGSLTHASSNNTPRQTMGTARSHRSSGSSAAAGNLQ